MGRGSILTKEQKIILGEFKKDDWLSSLFYFTGGTALSEFYLQHRLSDDLDFFTQGTFDSEPVFAAVNSWSKKHGFTIELKSHGLVYTYFFKFKGGKTLKVDFARYPYPSIEKPKVSGNLKIDSLYDIAANKLLTINQRTNVKDFVDLYFLLKKFNFWQLKDGVIAKFNMELDLNYTAVDFMKVDKFESLPRMLKKLELSTVKEFFRNQAKRWAELTFKT